MAPTTPESTARDTTLDTLIVPDAPEALIKDDHKKVPYWHESDWVKHADRRKDCGQSAPKLGFLTDKDGGPVTESRIRDFMSHAKQTWNANLERTLPPPS
jgi:hypothetical protein